MQTTVAFHAGVGPCPGGGVGAWTGRRGFTAMLTGSLGVLPFIGLAIVVWMLRGRGIGPHQIDLPAVFLWIGERLGPRLGHWRPSADPGSPWAVTAITGHGYADFESWTGPPP